jgi:DNA-binding FadR family transcriptional regulator
MSQSLSEHFEIIDAIESGDAEKADRISRQHVTIQGERFHDLLAHMEKER